jgi:hypothetical protein
MIIGFYVSSLPRLMKHKLKRWETLDCFPGWELLRGICLGTVDLRTEPSSWPTCASSCSTLHPHCPLCVSQDARNASLSEHIHPLVSVPAQLSLVLAELRQGKHERSINSTDKGELTPALKLWTVVNLRLHSQHQPFSD